MRIGGREGGREGRGGARRSEPKNDAARKKNNKKCGRALSFSRARSASFPRSAGPTSQFQGAGMAPRPPAGLRFEKEREESEKEGVFEAHLI